jgi:transcriptional regulator
MPKHEFLQGTLDMMILRTLQWGPQHGHGIGQAIRLKSDDVLQIEHGSLYPALHRLERQGWISAEWKQSEANRRAKYYKLTPSGKRQLAREEFRWAAVVKTVARVMRRRKDGESMRWLSRRLAKEQDLEDEIAAHLAIEVKQGIEAGETPEEAERSA